MSDSSARNQQHTHHQSELLQPARPVGIVGYGAYVPRYRLPATEISRIWKGGLSAEPIGEKSVPGLDEDVVTMSLEAARNALTRAGVNPVDIRAVWVGSESHPYAVKPTSTIVAEALGIVPATQAADWEFACKAGSEAVVAAMGLVGSEMARYALAMGVDTAQGRPGDALEYTAAAGGGAFLIGPAGESLAEIEGAYSFVTDTPDFWRRAYQKYPEHGGRFTGRPAYFKHIHSAVSALLEGLDAEPESYDYAVFHQPNEKFPRRVAGQLGFTAEQIAPGMLSPRIGNTYAGSSLIGLTAVLDIAQPGDRILVASFGSGAGSDAISLRVTEKILEKQGKALKTEDYIARRTEIDYAEYLRMRGKITLK
ncbi:MAG: hydroxymethylglutaryl-CoA synthase [Anaerolineales bacterium]|nr:hydroxymethylglutaryl-CoA synthase [Anaerolineales bacterium]